MRVSGRRRGANGRERHRLAQREKCDAVLDTHVDNGADCVTDVAWHLEIDEYTFFAQRLQERRQTTRHEQLEAHLEE